MRWTFTQKLVLFRQTVILCVFQLVIRHGNYLVKAARILVHSVEN